MNQDGRWRLGGRATKSERLRHYCVNTTSRDNVLEALSFVISSENAFIHYHTNH